jgi:hypothetical protein
MFAPSVLLAAPVRAAAAMPPLRAKPSARGREILRLAAAHQAHFVADAGEELGYREAIQRIARPVTSMSDVVDRLIVAAHWSDPSQEIECAQLVPLLAGLLAIAGIRVGQCCTGDWRRAAELAASPAARGLDL